MQRVVASAASRGLRAVTTVSAVSSVVGVAAVSEPLLRRQPSLWNDHQQRGYRIDGNQVRPGITIERDGRLWDVVKAQHSKTGRGAAFMQVELRSLKEGTKLNVRLRSAEAVERAELDDQEMTVVEAHDGEEDILVEDIYGDTMPVSRSLFGTASAFLTPGMEVTLKLHDDEPVRGTLPTHVTCVVQETEPPMKGATAAGSSKPAVLHNGVKVSVPAYIVDGEEVIVDTRSKQFVKRA